MFPPRSRVREDGDDIFTAVPMPSTFPDTDPAIVETKPKSCHVTGVSRLKRKRTGRHMIT